MVKQAVSGLCGVKEISPIERIKKRAVKAFAWHPHILRYNSCCKWIISCHLLYKKLLENLLLRGRWRLGEKEIRFLHPHFHYKCYWLLKSKSVSSHHHLSVCNLWGKTGGEENEKILCKVIGFSRDWRWNGSRAPKEEVSKWDSALSACVYPWKVLKVLFFRSLLLSRPEFQSSFHIDEFQCVVVNIYFYDFTSSPSFLPLCALFLLLLVTMTCLLLPPPPPHILYYVSDGVLEA